MQPQLKYGAQIRKYYKLSTKNISTLKLKKYIFHIAFRLSVSGSISAATIDLKPN